ncbi:16579_t:CDS:2 [Dentiscutata erythropus]|uniref:16579_t:CDS:1 n=1 Tax=Dentiscutata erythropus TaxID=1348616 RepID=A0A9N9H8W7_9GLOM|nr:16579_t:CDS:2 [Dentiscutata erythropus]
MDLKVSIAANKKTLQRKTNTNLYILQEIKEEETKEEEIKEEEIKDEEIKVEEIKVEEIKEKKIKEKNIKEELDFYMATWDGIRTIKKESGRYIRSYTKACVDIIKLSSSSDDIKKVS